MEPTEHAWRLDHVTDRRCIGSDSADVFLFAWLPPETWDRPSFIRGAGEHYVLGFTPPYKVENELLVFACAEVLLRSTEDLDREQFVAYFNSVVDHLLYHVIEMAAMRSFHVQPDLVAIAVNASHALEMPDSHATFMAVADAARTP